MNRIGVILRIFVIVWFFEVAIISAFLLLSVIGFVFAMNEL